MKCSFVFIALLIAFAVASVPEDAAATLDLESSLTTLISNGVPLSNSSDPQIRGTSLGESLAGDSQLQEWFNQLNEATRKNETWSAGHYVEAVDTDDSLSNATTAGAAAAKKPLPNLDGYYRFDVRIGKDATHTGTLRKGRMFKRMYSALKACGIAHKNPSIPGFCSDDRPECPDHCRIEQIVYSKNGEWATDSHVALKVKFSYFDIKHHPKIQDLGFRIVARVFELMTMQGNNCLFHDFPWSRRTLLCSVADKVELAFPINGGLIQGVLNVELIWSKKTGKNTFTCQGNTEGDVDAMMWTDFRDPLSEAMAWPAKQILPFVFCAEDNCFKQDLKIGEPWHEGKGCKTLDWPVGCDPDLTGPSNPKLNCPRPRRQ